MSLKLPSLERLILELKKLPGVGEKSAQRFAFQIIKNGKNYSSDLKEALSLVESEIKLCKSCYVYTEAETCHICSDDSRDPLTICVVEEAFDILKFEQTGSFKGLYHVLQGALSPLDGIHPDDLKINELIEKVITQKIKEIILAVDADLEGDTTALYLTKKLQDYPVKLTRIAYGIPFGSDIDYIDQRTLNYALENRVSL